jgi:hypothetical protein
MEQSRSFAFVDQGGLEYLKPTGDHVQNVVGKLELHVPDVVAGLDHIQDSQAFFEDQFEKKTRSFSYHGFWIITEYQSGLQNYVVHEVSVAQKRMIVWEIAKNFICMESN